MADSESDDTPLTKPSVLSNCGIDVKLETAPFDSRFPNQNQTKHCYVSFLEYHRCIKTRGQCYEPCQYFKRVYQSLCPNEWTKKWTEQIENGNFAGERWIK